MSAPRARADRFVVVPLDGSPAAAAALPVAQTVAAQLGARVQALRFGVEEDAVGEPWRLMGLEAAPASEVLFRYEAGDPVDGILRASADPSVVLVVISTHGHDISRGQRLSLVPRRVLAEAIRPILVTRPEVEGPRSRPLKRLLVPLDGTPSTTGALAPAMDLARRLRVSIDLLYVLYPFQPRPAERGSMTLPSYVDQPQYEWPAWRAKVVEWLRCSCDNVPKDAKLDVYLARGIDAEEIGAAIVAFAAEHDDDAIVVVRRSRLDQGRADILQHLLDASPCPVLVVPGPLRASPPRRDTRRTTARA